MTLIDDDRTHRVDALRNTLEAAVTWSPQESALMNVIGALKAYLRGRPESAINQALSDVARRTPGG